MHLMKVLFLVSLCSFSPLNFARELVVTNKNLVYNLKTSTDSISFRAQEIMITLERKKCNEHIVNNINKTLDSFLASPFLNFKRPEFVEVKLDGVVGYMNQFGDRADYLLSMYERIKTAKIEENLNCSKAK